MLRNTPRDVYDMGVQEDVDDMEACSGCMQFSNQTLPQDFVIDSSIPCWVRWDGGEEIVLEQT